MVLAAAIAAMSSIVDAAETPSIGRNVGRMVPDFTLKDASGNPVRLYGFRGKKAVVVVFLGTDCPVGNLYAPRLAELARAYREKGVVFLGVNSNAHESTERPDARRTHL
jgi:peroxiredoxin